ncbi:DUF2778 domain-containing protein [Microvirga rosea]|uniref:DUF2778 domain-containing protein n=1 Tax=Microvirga rosea TaxID=2715425 RepID=UPI001D09A786|nr:DUF2778 domain-containing protein [Microvirga rosea]MCB8822246.1 DUF2778 domain-containing protein [Microvirga rosea]
MVHIVYPSGGRVRQKRRSQLALVAMLATILTSTAALLIDHSPQDNRQLEQRSSSGFTNPEVSATASVRTYDRAILDPAPALKPEALDLGRNAPLAAALRSPPPPAIPLEQVAASNIQENVQPLPPIPPARMALSTQPVPLPVPRPAGPTPQKSTDLPRMASTSTAATRTATTQPTTSANNPSFFEKLFGIRPSAQPPSPPAAAMSYAALENGTGSIAPTSRFNSTAAPSAGVAVYDISAQVVYMPNGERLEAHSGLGDKLDDPRYVHVRMRGATPPGTYDLTERERLFHGVRALRLNPIGGSAAIYGRDGILAHTYMLGPNGDSNGCVSFKNYDRFLQAYLRGEVKRLVVVTGRGQDVLPRIVNNRNGSRLARDG